MSIGYVSPEAALAGPIGLIKNGDTINIDIALRRIDLDIDDSEIKKRREEFEWTFPENDYPRYLRMFVKNVGSMAKGGIWE